MIHTHLYTDDEFPVPNNAITLTTPQDVRNLIALVTDNPTAFQILHFPAPELPAPAGELPVEARVTIIADYTRLVTECVKRLAVLRVYCVVFIGVYQDHAIIDAPTDTKPKLEQIKFLSRSAELHTRDRIFLLRQIPNVTMHDIWNR